MKSSSRLKFLTRQYLCTASVIAIACVSASAMPTPALTTATVAAGFIGGSTFLYMNRPDPLKNGYPGIEEDFRPLNDNRLTNIVNSLSEKAGVKPPVIWRDMREGSIAAIDQHSNMRIGEGFYRYGYPKYAFNLTPAMQTSILAHEIAHAKNKDTARTIFEQSVGQCAVAMAIAAPFLASGPVDLKSHFMKVSAVALLPFVSLYNSRVREYLADETAARMIGTAKPLIDAFSAFDKVNKMNSASPETHDMAQRFNAMFSTHPSLPARVERLREIEKELTAERENNERKRRGPGSPSL